MAFEFEAYAYRQQGVLSPLGFDGPVPLTDGDWSQLLYNGLPLSLALSGLVFTVQLLRPV